MSSTKTLVRRRPQIFEAIQFNGTPEQATELGIHDSGSAKAGIGHAFSIKDPSGTQRKPVMKGDWILFNAAGEMDSCLDSYFQRSFEPFATEA